MKHRSLHFSFAVLLVAAVFLAACGDKEQQEQETTWLEPRTDTTATAEPVPEVAAGATMIVMLQDGLIALPEGPIAPGPVVFTIENRGTQLHNLFIEGQDADRAAEQPIAAGESTTLDVKLEPGTYTLYCPVLDHRTKGEQVELTVER